jgi:carbon storage regulator CsrA
MQTFLRGVNESLVIGHDVVVTVLEIQSTWVRLGIRDPKADPAYWEETVYLDDDDLDEAEFSLVIPSAQSRAWLPAYATPSPGRAFHR